MLRFESWLPSHQLSHLYGCIFLDLRVRNFIANPRLIDRHFDIPRSWPRLCGQFLGFEADLSLSVFFGRSDSDRFKTLPARYRRLEPENCALELPVVREVFAKSEKARRCQLGWISS